MRVGIIALQHESNTFARSPTGLEAFRADALLTGEAIRETWAGSHHEVGGFFAGLEEAAVEAVPLLLALAVPGGAISAAASRHLLDTLRERLEHSGELDGFLVAPHGAAVAEGCPDFDGHWLGLLRHRAGPGRPIVGTLDLHANVSRRMVAATDALLSYRTNPHLDQRQMGLAAARLLVRTLRGEVRPAQVLAAPPVAISIDRQNTAESPCVELYREADRLLEAPGILASGVILGFPYADVEEMGSSFIVIADGKEGDRERAVAAADRLARHLVDERHDFACRLTDVDAAIAEATAAGGRVCLLDMGDNVGGGAPGNGTTLARALQERAPAKSLVCLHDPAAAARARAAGPGVGLTLTMGGSGGGARDAPLEATVVVESLHDGRFEEEAIRHGGRVSYDMGPTAVVRTAAGMTVLLTSRRVPPFSLGQLTRCGLDPEAFRILVAKGVHAPLAAYRQVCDRFIRVDTPGITCADMTRLPFHHRRRPLYPFEEVTGAPPGG